MPSTKVTKSNDPENPGAWGFCIKIPGSIELESLGVRPRHCHFYLFVTQVILKISQLWGSLIMNCLQLGEMSQHHLCAQIILD